jgi:hypothetical protein
MGWSLRDVAIVVIFVAVGIGLVMVITWLPYPLGVLFGAGVLTIGTVVAWLAGGAAVVTVVVWLVPVLTLMLALALWPSRALALILTGVIVGPIAAWFFRPIERALWWFTERVGRWLLDHSLSRTDRRTLSKLRRAGRGTPKLRTDSRQLDDLPRTLAAMRQHADDILAVDAPDLGWKQVIGDAAAPVILYREMWQGQRSLDFDLAREEVVRSRRALREFLSSRSRLYRVLSHRFVETDERLEDDRSR